MFKILILGDGNFSFSLSLLEKFFNQKDEKKGNEAVDIAWKQKYLNRSAEIEGVEEGLGNQLFVLATSFDSREELVKKYDDFPIISQKIAKFKNVKVMHEINAWDLNSYFPTDEKFDLIIWNHPHLGTEDFRLHQFLMAHFFASCKQVLNHEKNHNATVRLSLVQGQETRWSVFKQAKKIHLNLQSFELFNELEWHGYVVKRNKHGGSFKNLHTKRHVRTVMKSCVYSFTLQPSPEEYKEFDQIHVALATLFGYEFDSLYHEKETPSTLLSDLTPAKSPHNPCKKSKRHSPPADLKCVYCLKQMANPRSYHQHVHTVHELKKFGSDWTPNRAKTLSCLQCEKKFADKEALEQHQINKHTSISPAELPDVFDDRQLGSTEYSANDYEYIPCGVCGQSCIAQDWGMELHLESLKPAIGLDMKCPLCVKEAISESVVSKVRGFIEQRALFQHYKFCRSRKSRNYADLVVDEMQKLMI